MTYRAIHVIGVEEAVGMLGESAANLESMVRAQPMINQILSIHYVRKWRDWQGFLYDTGRLMASWTDTSLSSGGDALRRAHIDRIEYGSSVWYGAFWSHKILDDIGGKTTMDVSEAMADYYAGMRTVRSHWRGDSRVRAYLRATHS